MRTKGKGSSESAGRLRYRGRGWGISPFLPVLILCLLQSLPARAELNLLWIRNISQGGGLAYHFFDNVNSPSKGESFSMSKHEAFESYRLGGDYSLLHPRLIDGAAQLDLQLDQEHERDQSGRSGSSSNFNLGYEISSQLLKESPTPLYVNANSHLATESPAFSRSFDVNSDDLSLALAIRNRMLPLRVSHLRSNSETSGLEQDRRQSSRVTNLNLEHRDETFSFTSLDLVDSGSESTLLSGGTDARLQERKALLSNNLNWFGYRGLSRNVNSSISYDRSEGAFRNTIENASCNGRVELGKALEADSRYYYLSNVSDSQSLQLQTGSISLTHRLYESLTTSLAATGSNATYNDGSEKSYSGGGGVAYRYRYPSQMVFSFSYNLLLGVTDHRRKDVLAAAAPERHAIPATDPRFVPLNHATFQPSTVVVQGAQTLISYSKDIDFSITPSGIQVLPGRMVGDKEVLISYSFLQDPKVSYRSTSHAVSTRLNYPDGQSYYLNFSSSDQTLLEGAATEVTLAPSHHLDLGYDYSADPYSAHLEYGWNKSFSSELQYFTGRCGYQTLFGSGILSVNANDYFSWNMQGDSANGRWNNAFNLQGDYRQKVNERVSGRVGVSYYNGMGEATSSHLFSANCNIDGRFGKTTATLSSNIGFGINSASWVRSESVSLTLYRYF